MFGIRFGHEISKLEVQKLNTMNAAELIQYWKIQTFLRLTFKKAIPQSPKTVVGVVGVEQMVQRLLFFLLKYKKYIRKRAYRKPAFHLYHLFQKPENA